MLHKLARKGWGRLQEVGLSTPYEDVFQFMCESFVRCQPKYDPATGFTFSAYYGRSCWNNFNKWAERLCLEHTQLGMVSVEVLGGASDGDESRDVYEFLDAADDDHDTPEERLEARQESHRAARALSPVAKQVIALLVHQTPEFMAFFDERNARLTKKFTAVTLGMIFEFLELSKPKGRQIKEELRRIYGVDL
ncbi:hypothetical protein AB6809_29840 [Paraburkholderia sp. RCC_158]|uniref:hypothetical protein n=1 Tax=Paraburkholderia sp. RCC_158 TaxID=3239220 RepID=UPI003524E224